MRTVLDTWERRITRAGELAGRDDAAAPLLRAYGTLLRLQRDTYATLLAQSDRLTGDLARDIAPVRACAVRLSSSLAGSAPPSVTEEAARLIDSGDAAIDAALLEGWASPAPEFLARLVLQPYAECLARVGSRPVGRQPRSSGAACPFCGGAPQLSVLHSETGSDGGGRSLQCAMCATVWPFRRVLCAQCGEEDERQLGYFQAPEFDHVRVDACERCRHYIKTIDLTRLGRAVPLVDEVASGSLDVWAAGRGYRKIERNLVGL